MTGSGREAVPIRVDDKVDDKDVQKSQRRVPTIHSLLAPFLDTNPVDSPSEDLEPWGGDYQFVELKQGQKAITDALHERLTPEQQAAFIARVAKLGTNYTPIGYSSKEGIPSAASLIRELWVRYNSNNWNGSQKEKRDSFLGAVRALGLEPRIKRALPRLLRQKIFPEKGR